MKSQKNAKMRKKIFFMFLFFIILSFIFPGANLTGNLMAQQKNTIETTDSNDSCLSVNLKFPAPSITKTGQYDKIILPGAPSDGISGNPLLPCREIKILIPAGKDVDIITPELTAAVNAGSNIIPEPAQEQIPFSKKPADKRALNNKIYNGSARYPARALTIGQMQICRGFRILPIRVYPVFWKPDTKEAFYYPQINIHVKWKTSKSPFPATYAGTDHDFNWIGTQVANPWELKNSKFKRTTLRGEIYEYLIITNAKFAPKFQRLLKHRKDFWGLTGTIITTDYIYSKFSGKRPDGGSDNQTRVRNAINYYYNTYGTRYVLLGGDADGSDVGGETQAAIIPARGFAGTVGDYNDKNIPADLYYACLDGTFDYNANGIYGEADDGPGGGEVDMMSEVFIGRVPVDSEEEADNFIDKVIAYEKADASVSPAMKNALMMGELLWDSDPPTYGDDYKDEIRYGSSSYGHETEGFNSNQFITILTLYERNTQWSGTSFIDKINEGLNVVNHLGHSDVNYSLKISNSDLASLTNDFYPVIYSQGCYGGSFDNRDSNYNYRQNDCILESLVTSKHGAVATIGNSRFGWGAIKSTNGASQHYDREFWGALCSGKYNRLGEMNAYSKEVLASRAGSGAMRWCYFEINLMGDPYMPVRISVVPYPPGNVRSLSFTNNAIKLTWDDRAVDEDNYYVFRREDRADYRQIVTLPANTEEYIDNDCQGEGSVYYYKIYAKNSRGSGISNEIAAYVPLNAPTGLNCTTANGTGVTLSWKDNSQQEKGYDIERKGPSDDSFVKISTTAANATSYGDLTPAEGTNTYRIKAVGSTDGVESAYSDEISVDITAAMGAASSGDGGGGGGGCFIATASYGTAMAKQVQILSRFRDEYLLTNSPGRKFVAFYYRNSPPIANAIRRNNVAKATVRLALFPIVALTTVMFKWDLDPTVFGLILLLGTCVIASAFRYIPALRKIRVKDK